MGISTHILDTERGRPAPGVPVILSCQEDSAWRELARGLTDQDGRASLLPRSEPPPSGTYRLRFTTGDYYAACVSVGLYPWVEITFTVRSGDQHLHIPLLLSANGYTTYRGS